MPATGTLVRMYDARDAELTIKVTGYQWRWQYDYLDDGVRFSVRYPPLGHRSHNLAPRGEHYLLEVDHPLVLPVGKKVRILNTAADVIHSWWCRNWAGKDAIPGFINEVWTQIEKPGIYRGQCAELCGRGSRLHADRGQGLAEAVSAMAGADEERFNLAKPRKTIRAPHRSWRSDSMSTASHTTTDHDHDHGPARGLSRWLLTTNHGYRHALPAVFVADVLHRRWMSAPSCSSPGLQIGQSVFFNQMTTLHALVMIFGARDAGLRRPGQLMILMMVGAPDMALPRMNNWSFWIMPFAFHAAADPRCSCRWRPGPVVGPCIRRWSLQTGSAFSVHDPGDPHDGRLLDHGRDQHHRHHLNLRAPGMTLMKMPLFVWTWLITAFLLIAVMPVLAGVVTMLLTDKFFGTSFFNAAGGGDPVMFQHIFWFFGHPEVYIMILPAFGVVSEIIPTFAASRCSATRRWCTPPPIAFLSFIVWAHHMFTTGMPLGGELFSCTRPC